VVLFPKFKKNDWIYVAKKKKKKTVLLSKCGHSYIGIIASLVPGVDLNYKSLYMVITKSLWSTNHSLIPFSVYQVNRIR
jgi:hypothetical protein